jgi:predicted nucleotidyltransferase
MLSKSSIIESILENRMRLKHFGIAQLGLFGSFARNEQNNGSDIDLVVKFEPGKKNIDNLLGAHEYLESIFGRKTELITRESLPQAFIDNISKEIHYVGL